MMRRMTLIRRRADVTGEAFSAHWAGPHAKIAKGYPGVRKYTQNHVIARIDTAPSDTFSCDGMAELWFADAEAMRVAGASPVTQALIEDEPVVFSGVTGLVLGDAGTDDGEGGAKIIVLGRSKTGAAPSAPTAAGMTFTSAAKVESIWRRQVLWSLPEPPDTVLVARFATAAAARAAFQDAGWPPLANLAPWHAYHVREVRVV